MEQGQDLGRAAADIFVRLRGRLAVCSPTAARVRHSLERASLVLAPHRQAQARTQRVGPLDQPLFTAASGSVTRTRPPCLRLRTTTPVSHQVRLVCQPKPAACRVRPIVSVLMPGRPSGAWQRCSQRAQRPTRRAITHAVRRPGNLGEDPALLDLAVAEPLAAAMARHHGGQPGMVETRNPARHSVAGAAANKPRGGRVTQSFGHSQQGPSTRHPRRRCAGRAAQPDKQGPLRSLQRTQRVLLLSRHRPPPQRSIAIMAHFEPSDPLVPERTPSR